MRNLRLAVPLSFLSMVFFPGATWIFFFTRHLDFQQIATIMGIGALETFLLEIPTGVFADIVGRKWAVTLSYFLFAAAMVGTAFSTTYFAFLFWTMVNGLVNALSSGSMEALVYDSLKEVGKEKTFDKWISRMEAMTWVGLFVSVIAGGYLYATNPQLPYFIEAIVMTVAMIMAGFLVEPKIDSQKYKLSDMVTRNLNGFKELFASAKMRYLTTVLAAIGLGYYIAADILGISQAKQYGLDTRAVGWVFGIGYLLSAGASFIYPRLNKKLGKIKLMWLAGGALVVSLVFAKYLGVAAGVVLILLRISSSTTFRNSRSVIVNAEITSQFRATTLSTLNLLTMLPYVILAPFIGAYIDRTSPNQFASVLGVGIVAILALAMFPWKFTEKTANEL